MAVAIGQALLTAGYIRPVSGSLQFSDSSDLYRYCANTGTLNAGTVPDSPSPSPSQPHISEEVPGLPPPAASTPDCSSSVQEPAWLQELADSPFRFEKRSSGNKRLEVEEKKEVEEVVPDGKVQPVEEPGELQEAGRLAQEAGQEAGGRLAQAVLDTTGQGEDTEEAAALEACYREHEARYLSSLLQVGLMPEACT